jgi:hypothetical protein
LLESERDLALQVAGLLILFCTPYFFFKKKRRIRDLVRVFIFTFYSFFFSFIESEKVGSDLITNYPYVLIDTWRFSVGMDLTVK